MRNILTRLAAFGFVTWITMWTIGIVSTITLFLTPPQAGGFGTYIFSPTAISLLFFAPMIGTVLAEVWGHWFNDFLCSRYIRTHGGKYKPENRLWGVYPAWLLGILGLVILGESLQHQYHWIGMAFGWGMNCFSTLGTTVAISAYLLDVFPQQAALAAAWMNAFRTVGGFSVLWFQAPWVVLSGPAAVFGSQAGVVAFFIISIIATQYFGEKWRKSFPPPATSRTN